MTSALPFVAIYADESCLGNGREGSNPGGAAGVIEHRLRTGAIARFDYWISEPATTNNRMALRSAIEALRVVSRKGRRLRVRFTSDSQYLVTGMNEWVPRWIERGWRRKGGELENADLWREAVALRNAHEVDWHWVRGHAGHPQNEYANYLAMRAARDQTSSNGAVPSGFEGWLARHREAGRLTADPAVFPDAPPIKPSSPALARLPNADAAITPKKRRQT